MNLQQAKARLNLLKTILESQSTMQRVSIVATKAMEGEHKTRIFTDGKASDGSKIGTYSTKEIYVSVPVVGLPKVSPQGKNGRSKYKNGKSKKSKYFKDGYKGFRDSVGRQTSTVDLNLTGTTESQLQTGLSGGKTTYGFTQQRAVEIMEGHEQRYGKTIIEPSKPERQQAVKAARREIKYIIERI